MLRIKDENDLRKHGPQIDPCDPTQAISIHQEDPPAVMSDVAPQDNDATSDSASFTRETSTDAISTWDDPTLLAGIQKECEEIRDLDSCYPVQYHQLGALCIEARKRFGDDNLRQILRREGIDSTKGWRAEQIAKFYTLDQVMEFPSLRAILKTLPPKQPRHPKTDPQQRADEPTATTVQTQPPAANDDDIMESFIRLGIKIKDIYGDEALDQALEQIRSHAPEAFDEVFVEI